MALGSSGAGPGGGAAGSAGGGGGANGSGGGGGSTSPGGGERPTAVRPEARSERPDRSATDRDRRRPFHCPNRCPRSPTSRRARSPDFVSRPKPYQKLLDCYFNQCYTGPLSRGHREFAAGCRCNPRSTPNGLLNCADSRRAGDARYFALVGRGTANSPLPAAKQTNAPNIRTADAAIVAGIPAR